MQIGSTQMVLIGVGIAALVAGAYKLGSDQAPPASVPATAAVPAAAPASAPAKAPAPVAAQTPPAHPPIAAASNTAPSSQIPATSNEQPFNHPANMANPGRQSIRFTHFRVGNRNVKAMLSDGDIVWVGTSGGVVKYDIKKDDYKLYDVRSGLLSNGVFHLSKSGDKLVVGTYGGGLSLLNPATEKWENYNIQHGLADAFVYDVLEMDNGDLWIATWSGANRVLGGELGNREKWETYTVANTNGGLPNDWVYGLAKGKNGEVWMATEGGLARFEEGQWQNWKHSDGLGAAYELVKDQIQFNRDPAKESSHHARQKVEMGLTYVNDIAYNPNYIVSLLVDEDGTVWAGTWGGGLAHFDGTEWKNYTVTDGLPANHIFMLGHEGQGRIWVGTSNGLARYDREKFTVFTKRDGLFADNVFSMANAADGSLWVGGFGGVTRLIGIEEAY